MKFYILDDMIASIKVLENILESNDMGEIIGTQTDPEIAIPEILSKKPDIVLIDLLMPGKDGISVVKEIRSAVPDISFVMVSQVVEKGMIEAAYEAGIEFFITKPNNRIEIEKVIHNVIEKRQMAQVLKGIRSVIGEDTTEKNESVKDDTSIIRIKKSLGYLGMLGESGTNDILAILEKLLSANAAYNSKKTIDEYADSLQSDGKIVKQRIRRAIKKGLTNIASIGVEDSYNNIYTEYANILFDFDAVRNEMNLIRGTADSGGSPSVDRFLEGLLLLSHSE